MDYITICLCSVPMTLAMVLFFNLYYCSLYLINLSENSTFIKYFQLGSNMPIKKFLICLNSPIISNEVLFKFLFRLISLLYNLVCSCSWFLFWIFLWTNYNVQSLSFLLDLKIVVCKLFFGLVFRKFKETSRLSFSFFLVRERGIWLFGYHGKTAKCNQ